MEAAGEKAKVEGIITIEMTTGLNNPKRRSCSFVIASAEYAYDWFRFTGGRFYIFYRRLHNSNVLKHSHNESTLQAMSSSIHR